MKDETGQDIILWTLLLVLIFITAWLGTEYLIIKEQNKQWNNAYNIAKQEYDNTWLIYNQRKILRFDASQIPLGASCDTITYRTNCDTMIFKINPPKGARIYRTHITWR